jgi:hypothetical protein
LANSFTGIHNPQIVCSAVAKSHMRKGFLIYEEMRNYLIIYEEAVSLQLLHSEFPYTVYEESLIFFFIGVEYHYVLQNSAIDILR